MLRARASIQKSRSSCARLGKWKRLAAEQALDLPQLKDVAGRKC
jgi:hypothetical protein